MKWINMLLYKAAAQPLWVRLLINIIVLLVVIVIGYWLIIGFVNQKTLDAKKLESRYKQIYLKNVANSKTLSQVQSQVQSINKVYLELADKLPQNNELYQLIDQLSQVAFDAGLKVKSLTPQPLEKKTGYDVFSIDLNADGSFDAFVQFVKSIVTLSRIIVVESYQLSPLNQTNNHRLLQMKITLKTYSINPSNAKEALVGVGNG